MITRNKVQASYPLKPKREITAPFKTPSVGSVANTSPIDKRRDQNSIALSFQMESIEQDNPKNEKNVRKLMISTVKERDEESYSEELGESSEESMYDSETSYQDKTEGTLPSLEDTFVKPANIAYHASRKKSRIF